MATSKCIVSTRNEDGGVSVTVPSRNCLAYLSSGERWGPRPPRGILAKHIARLCSDGVAEAHAARFIRAMQYGGATEAEAWEIIRDRSLAHWTRLHDLVDASELPARWFRDAWSRSHNGGPVGVDLTKARRLQWRYIASRTKVENARRELELDGPAPIKLETMTLQTAIRHARDADELRRVWPEQLPHPMRYP